MERERERVCVCVLCVYANGVSNICISVCMHAGTSTLARACLFTYVFCVLSQMPDKRAMQVAAVTANSPVGTAVFYAVQASKPVNQAACLVKGSDGTILTNTHFTVLRTHAHTQHTRAQTHHAICHVIWRVGWSVCAYGGTQHNHRHVQANLCVTYNRRAQAHAPLITPYTYCACTLPMASSAHVPIQTTHAYPIYCSCRACSLQYL